MDGAESRGMGWQRDLKDARDYQPDDAAALQLLEELGPCRTRRRRLPESVDLREFLPAARDQGSLNASSAFAVLELVSYFEARASGRVLSASRLFLYQMALKLLGLTGNACVDLRTTFKALVRLGTPPERYWPYQPGRLGHDPTDAFLFSFARDYEGIRYVRLDASGGDKTLHVVKSYLAAGFVSTFGFSVPSSLSPDADISFRPRFDSVRGGQAVVAVGYDDSRRIASDIGAPPVSLLLGRRLGRTGLRLAALQLCDQSFCRRLLDGVAAGVGQGRRTVPAGSPCCHAFRV